MRTTLGFLAILAILLASFSVAPTPVGAQNCQFILGFATLHSLIPNIVGNCLENEQFNPQNGDALQLTTGTNTDGSVGGLLVWRKADNFTAFTDGFNTWVNGPFGLQQRLNSQRFFWETNPAGLPIIPTPVAGQQCHTAGLSLSVGQGQAAVGHQGATYIFTNNLDVSCTFFGYPGAQMLDAQFNFLPTNVVRGGGFIFQDPGPQLVVVPAGGTASFGLEFVVVPTGDETTCPAASQLEVTPPDEFDPIIISSTIAPCNNGTIHVTAVQPGS
ncbi:MAG: DUF4232 domain-containing protein [Chloroflexota bacterium]|nr:MAG: DUF4232 domain-containing protein [Chloroflexota bacterium]